MERAAAESADMRRWSVPLATRPELQFRSVSNFGHVLCAERLQKIVLRVSVR